MYLPTVYFFPVKFEGHLMRLLPDAALARSSRLDFAMSQFRPFKTLDSAIAGAVHEVEILEYQSDKSTFVRGHGFSVAAANETAELRFPEPPTIPASRFQLLVLPS